jgi:hypothetical protein
MLLGQRGDLRPQQPAVGKVDASRRRRSARMVAAF